MIQKKQPLDERLDPGQSNGNVIPIFDRESQSVVIVDDQATGRAILKSIVSSISPNISCRVFAEAHQALAYCETHIPDLLITDYKMPQMNGIELIRGLRAIKGAEDIPVVVVTVVHERNVRYEALEAGATDFLSRPFDHYECQARCRNLLLLQQHQKQVINRAGLLQGQVSKATQAATAREQEALMCLAKAGEYRDEGTGNHVYRMAYYSLEIARGLDLDEEACDQIVKAAPLHDIGKIGIPDAILLKPARLTADERAVMEKHTTIGFEILKDSTSTYLSMAGRIALSHHEHYDGKGYPHGLKGDEIPLEARIVAVADTLDALMTVRPYKSAWPREKALAYLKAHSGTHFDPDCVAALFARQEQVLKIYEELPDKYQE
ncbi:MAG TPA: response regulator [Thiolapillus brandeum]|uniref:Response regulator n=1 Tax=Thiolapillus brandeum TaxID=1076588 RepID=A0A831KD82_9GAMM|nr:response regulator [Thiolapillus brandeum]